MGFILFVSVGMWCTSKCKKDKYHAFFIGKKLNKKNSLFERQEMQI